MNITVNGRVVAEASIQGATVRPVVGAYEFLFSLNIAMHPQGDYACRIFVVGALVSLRTDRAGVQRVGFAQPQAPIIIKQSTHLARITPALVLPLQPGQVAAIERSRETGDVVFELQMIGVDSDQNGEHLVQNDWRFQVPRSDWLQKLRDAGARDVLLLEVPLPLVDRPKEWETVSNAIQDAEKHFREGDYHACVSSCRIALDELGHLKFGSGDWAGPQLDQLGKNRNGMTASDRETALWAVVRHYTHLAHHGPSSGGVVHFSRATAQLLLTMVAALIANAQSA